jgi:uncharacterized protein YdaU (DUF1376 family)
MHWYKRNIGDYHKKAGRLTMLQHGAYTLLMDSCYDREQFPTKEEAIDWVWASTPEEIQAVEFVLSRFFALEDGVYTQRRIKEEVEGYKSKAENNKRIALEREAKRRNKRTNQHEPCTHGSQDVNETPPNQEPITNNQEPITKVNRAKRFAPPTLDQAFDYFKERGLADNKEAQKFIDFYEMKGWMVGKNKMKDWKAAIRNWLKNSRSTASQPQGVNEIGTDFSKPEGWS